MFYALISSIHVFLFRGQSGRRCFSGKALGHRQELTEWDRVNHASILTASASSTHVFLSR